MIFEIKKYSPAVLAGQKIITGFYGTELTKDTKKYIKEVNPGGLILFARNIENPPQLKKLNKDILNFYKELKLPPPFISVDQEGGAVSRMKEPKFKEISSLESVNTAQKARDHADEMCKIIKEFHFNMNMAPVLDIASLEKKSIMKSRSFPGSPEKVAELGIEMIKQYIKNKIIPVGKHFPGIGKTTLDSHLCLPVAEQSLEFMNQNDFIPFKKGINKGLPAIMFSHILYKDLDDQWPASLSEKICRNILRENFNFQGIAMTDDLDMKAITSDAVTAASQIIKADQDIALICHSIENTKTIFDYFKNELNSGNKDVLNSVKRIFKVKNLFLV